MNPTDEVLAKAELPEMAGSDDWLSKFDERYRAALKDVQRPSNQLKPVENLYSSDGELNERFDDLPRPRPLPKQVEDLLSQSSQHSDDEASERTIIRYRLLAIESEIQKRGARGFARYLIAICVGAAVILAWQAYGAATKQVIATRAPELGWSADWAQQFGRVKPRAGAESNAVQSSVAETQKVRQLEADIATLRQTVEQRLGAEQQTVEQLAARQDQLVSEINKLHAATSKSLRESQRILRRVTSQQRNVDVRHVK